MSGPLVAGRPVAPGRQSWVLPPARYRHPGDAIRLLAAGLAFAGAAAATLATHGTYAGASATAVTALRPATTAGRVLSGLMTAAFVVADVAALATTLLYRRFRLLASLAGGALLTGAALIGITDLAGGERPPALAAAAVSQWPWLIGPSLASPLLGAAVAGVVTAAPLRRSWRRTAWITLWLAGVAQLLTGISSPLEVILAFAHALVGGNAAVVLDVNRASTHDNKLLCPIMRERFDPGDEQASGRSRLVPASLNGMGHASRARAPALTGVPARSPAFRTVGTP